jgi:uncharacterized protein (DUF1501 family)
MTMTPTRRSVLKTIGGGLGLAGLSTLAGPLSGRMAFAAGPYSGDVLIVLSMRGGQDGLSVVPPVGDPNYQTLRPNIGIPASLAVPLGGVFGLHPGLAALKPLYDAGTFGVVHAVGQPSATRSHFQAQIDLELAAPGTSSATGWLDRLLTARGTATPFQAVQVGSPSSPDSLGGPAPDLAMQSIDDFNMAGIWTGIATQYSRAIGAMYADQSLPLAPQVATTLAALGTTTALKTAGYTPANGVTYPTSDLGKALSDVARLIKSGVGLQIATLDYGNWDMHAGLGKPGVATGWMHKQLLDVAACLKAFAADMGAGMSNVTLVTMTEFGRRAHENGSGGVDHGHGQAMLMLGGGLNGGQVFGAWPGLATAALDTGDLAGANDYRNVLGEILVKRCGVGSLTSIFPGLSYSPLGVVRTRSGAGQVATTASASGFTGPAD